jgi:hypothetical protein
MKRKSISLSIIILITYNQKKAVRHFLEFIKENYNQDIPERALVEYWSKY